MAMSRTSAIKTLESIHAAGVLHRDIRSWNVVVDDEGLSIIDFDRASLTASEFDYTEEMRRMKRFVDGGYIDEEPIIGKEYLPADIQRHVRANLDMYQ